MRNLIKIFGVLVLPAAMLGMPGAAAAATSCLNNNLEKLCLDITSVPGDTVQPKGLGGTDTFVKYSATFRNAGQQSTRNVILTFNLSTAAGFDSMTADPNLNCTLSGGTISCALDKFEAFKAYSISALAYPPPYTGATTPTTMTNTGTYGWNGNTKSTVQTINVSTTAGKSYVPPNTTVTLVTDKRAEDPAQQVTPESPLWSSITLPPRPQGYYAQVFITNSGPSSAGDCLGGVFANQGGVYVCRDTANPTRWVQVDLPADLFTADDPIEQTTYWDASIVPSTQLPPNGVAKTGLPMWAIFYNQTEQGVPYGRTRAFSNACDSVTPVAPCLMSVEQLGSGDWRATFLKPNDGSDMQSNDPLLPLVGVLNWIMNTATAVSVPIGPITK